MNEIKKLLSLENYSKVISNLPKEGKYITGFQTDENIIVYQAYNPAIAEYAVENQAFGGNSFSYNRMSWIKPGFLWMMFRAGWASKENQERILAISIKKTFFEDVLLQGVFSSYKSHIYESQENWKAALSKSDVRIQWDPDHSPYGGKLERRAIQIGMKGKTLEAYGKEEINKIIDITDFVKAQKILVDKKELDQLLIPNETVYQAIDKSKLTKYI